VKRVIRRYQTAFGVVCFLNHLFMRFTNISVRHIVCVKRTSPLVQNSMYIQLLTVDILEPVNGKIIFDSCKLLTKILDVLYCLVASK
jgi:hypothetical protein